MKTLREIAESYGIKLVFVDEEYEKRACMEPDHFLNRSFVIGDDEIIIGKYDNPMKMNLSFFHELGHCVDTDKVPHSNLPGVLVLRGSKFDIERRAWQIGLGLANSFGYTFDTNTYVWMLEELGTYARKEYVGT